MTLMSFLRRPVRDLMNHFSLPGKTAKAGETDFPAARRAVLMLRGSTFVPSAESFSGSVKSDVHAHLLQCFSGQRCNPEADRVTIVRTRVCQKFDSVPTPRDRNFLQLTDVLITVFPVRASGKDRIDLCNSQYDHQFSNCSHKCCAGGNEGRCVAFQTEPRLILKGSCCPYSQEEKCLWPTSRKPVVRPRKAGRCSCPASRPISLTSSLDKVRD